MKKQYLIILFFLSNSLCWGQFTFNSHIVDGPYIKVDQENRKVNISFSLALKKWEIPKLKLRVYRINLDTEEQGKLISSKYLTGDTLISGKKKYTIIWDLRDESYNPDHRFKIELRLEKQRESGLYLQFNGGLATGNGYSSGDMGFSVIYNADYFLGFGLGIGLDLTPAFNGSNNQGGRLLPVYAILTGELLQHPFIRPYWLIHLGYAPDLNTHYSSAGKLDYYFWGGPYAKAGLGMRIYASSSRKLGFHIQGGFKGQNLKYIKYGSDLFYQEAETFANLLFIQGGILLNLKK